MIRTFIYLISFILPFSTSIVHSSDHQRYRPGEVLVKLKDSSKTPLGLYVESTRDFKHLKDVKVLVIDQFSDVDDAIKKLNEDPNVLYAEPNIIYRAYEDTVIPNDPFFSKLWGHYNDVNTGFDVGLISAWALSTGSKDVVVAVIDTGVDYNHPDLQDNMWVNEAELNGEEGVDDDSNGYVDDIHGWDFNNKDNDPMDDNSHGTHCAGVIGASGNNSIGIVGVNWNVKIMPLKFLANSGGGSLEDAVRAVEYAIDNGAHILSNSWGSSESSQVLNDVFKLAEESKVLSIAAAGNSSSNNDTNPHYPASIDIPTMISVASTDIQDQLSGFSCYGMESVDIAAPGSSIYSTIPNSSYGSKSGTSMATPYVAGAAALLKAYDPTLDIYQIRDRILKTVDKRRSLRKFVKTQGRLNIYNALMNIETEKPWPDVDPSKFTEFEKSISSPHPYPKKHSEKWEIEHQGAKYMRVHFSSFATERKFDVVKLYDGDGKFVESYSGTLGSFWSDVVSGDKITIEFTSDASIQKEGFDIDKYGAILD